MSKLVISLVVLTVLIAGAGGYWWMQRHRGITWARVNAMIAAKFPDVPQMSVAPLQAWLADSRRPQPVLLDVRGRIEYEVSHLHHARWINTDESVGKAMAGIPHDQPIVAYCSVGYRSSAYCVRLMKDGFTNVHDLKCSIFAWANAGLPVYRAGKIVHHVHPYDRQWGRLLKRSLWEFAQPPMPARSVGQP
ncbi:MAG: rhodanese-like domain-containing protein [Phycisphaerae bacterium]|nr:rhodanese-like domain-containing protein [Phycisphaerae bacterium]